MTQRLCRACSGWHDLDESWPQACGSHFRGATKSGVQIVKDIEPYKAVATDVNGKRPVISGRRQHREFLARNGYREVGNEQPKPFNPQYVGGLGQDIKRAMERMRG